MVTALDPHAHGLWDVDGGLVFGITAYAVILLFGMYGIGVTRLWRHPAGRRSVPRWRAAAFAGGLVIAMAVVSPPPDQLAHELFSVHMLQHLVLAFVVAPLLVLGRPVLILGVAVGASVRVPRRMRRWLVRHRASVGAGLALALIHVFCWYLWHLPGPYVLALENPSWHAVEHAMFVLSGMTLTWHAAVAAPGLAAALGTIISMLGVMPLAALLVFTDTYWYAGHAAAAHGLTALEDQQLGGALMWFPGSLAYLVAVAVVLLRRLGTTTSPAAHPMIMNT